MTENNAANHLLSEDKDLDGPLAKQREIVMRAVRTHQVRHRWVVRTFSTFFWSSAAGAYILAVITQSETLVVSAIFWLLLGAIVLLHSRLRHIELRIDEVQATLDGLGDSTGSLEKADS
jgi:hypothetical protein